MKTQSLILWIASALLLLKLPVYAHNVAEDKSLLYRISGNGLETESYLYGTIHMICEEQFILTENLGKAFSGSKRLVMELDMDDPQIMQKMQAASIHPEMKNIKEVLSEEDKEAFNAFLMKNFGVGIQQMGILRPFVLSAIISMKSLECEKIQSYEQYFLGQAREKDIKVEGLESVEFQMGLFDEIPYEEQVENLVETIRNPKDMNKEFAEITKHYVNQDLHELHKALLKEEQLEKYTDILLSQRNIKWVPLIEDHIKAEESFIAVGAGHLSGEEGLISLLRKAGYKVEAVL